MCFAIIFPSKTLPREYPRPSVFGPGPGSLQAAAHALRQQVQGFPGGVLPETACLAVCLIWVFPLMGDFLSLFGFPLGTFARVLALYASWAKSEHGERGLADGK